MLKIFLTGFRAKLVIVLNDPRYAAAQVVSAVADQGESLDIALSRFGETLSNEQQSLFREISYGAVRWYLYYLIYVNKQLKKPFKPKDRLLYGVLITALYQLDETRQASHAVVSQAVSLCKVLKRQWASGLVNAILRNYLRRQEKAPKVLGDEEAHQSFAPWMATQISHAWPQFTTHIYKASQQKPPMTLRVNQRHVTTQAYLKRLQGQQIKANACQDSKIGITLEKPCPVTQLPGFDQGWVSVQDESAQLAVPLMDIKAGHKVLDACAAPGGKSLHILEMVDNLAQLVLLDLPYRLPRLHENIKRVGGIASIISGDLLDASKWWQGEVFNRVLLDVPCSGTGVIRRHPDIKLRRSEQSVLQFASQQSKLLNQAWRLLAPGGKLLYTTCSILPQENEDIMQRFLSETPQASAAQLPDFLGLVTGHGRQRLPGVHNGDGFYYSLLDKEA